jgi:hypothetical protein
MKIKFIIPIYFSLVSATFKLKSIMFLKTISKLQLQPISFKHLEALTTDQS